MVNAVTIVKASLGPTMELQQIGDGIVFLSGCDVERGLTIGRRFTLKSARVAHGNLTVEYTTDPGPDLRLRLIDMRGAEVASITLEADSDQPRKLDLDIDMLDRGIYLLEVRNGENRSVIPLMISDR